MPRRVVITGTGMISALGDSAETVHAALCEGRSALAPIESFDPHPVQDLQAGELKDFTPRTYLGERNFRPLDRASQLTASAVHLVLEASGWTPEMCGQHEVGLVLGTMFCGVHTIAEFDRRGVTAGPARVRPLDFANTVINAAAGQTAIWHNLRGINSTIATGGSSGLQALAYAADIIRSGRVHALVTGGVEELCFESLYGFYQAGCLAGSGSTLSDQAYPIPFDARRNGFALGEGAAFLMLEDAETAATRGASILAEIIGSGTGYDYSQGQEESVAVAVLEQAMQAAVHEAGLSPEDIDCVSASANGSVQGDRYEALALASFFGDAASRLPVTAIKSMLGDTLGASGAIQAIDFIETMKDGMLPGIPTLEQNEAGFPFPQVGCHTQSVDLRTGLLNAVSADGNGCSLVIRREPSIS